MLGSEIIDGWIFISIFSYLFSIRQLIQAFTLQRKGDPNPIFFYY